MYTHALTRMLMHCTPLRKQIVTVHYHMTATVTQPACTHACAYLRIPLVVHRVAMAIEGRPCPQHEYRRMFCESSSDGRGLLPRLPWITLILYRTYDLCSTLSPLLTTHALTWDNEKVRKNLPHSSHQTGQCACANRV